jgi:hypothetical protein
MPNLSKNLVVILNIILLLMFACNDNQENKVNGTDNDTDGGCIIDQESDIGSDYEEIIPGTFDISAMTDALSQPTRIKISPDRNFMFVAQLDGDVALFVRDDCNWVLQENLFFDLGNLMVSGERGLTGLFFGANFDPESPDPLTRDIFLTYQARDGDVFRNRITRVTFDKQQDDFVGTDATLIYEGPQPPSSAHQIQDGIGFIYQGAPHFLVSIGDGSVFGDSLDISKEGHGKLLLMQRDGSDPLGPRPFPSAPKIQAIGIRNVYGIAMIPESIDPRRRILGVENGNAFQDRIWLLEIVDFDLEINGQVSLGYKGSDVGLSWSSVPDVNAPGDVKPEGVLALISPVVAPTSVSIHPGGGIIPPPGNNKLSFVIVYFGKTFSSGNSPGKQVVLAVIENLDSQPSITLTPIIHRKDEVAEIEGNPLPLDADPLTGEFYFADAVTGKLYRVVPR